MKEFIKNNSKVLSLLVIVILLGVIGFAFAYTMNDINIDLTTGEYNVVYSGTLTLPSTRLQPVVDSEVASSEDVMKVEFTVKGASTNPTDRDIIYDVVLTDLDIPEALQHSLLKWSLYKNGSEIAKGSFSKDFDVQTDNRMVLTEIQQDLPSYAETADSYIFYVWISETCTDDVTTCTEDSDVSSLMGQTFSGEIRIELSTEGKKELIRIVGDAGETLMKLELDDLVNDGTPDFSTTATTDEGIYAAEDDLGTSYYFRGASERNYVYFAGYYWRIIRINGDGTIRMIYDGTSAHDNGEISDAPYVNKIAFNSTNSDNAYVGYMYGTIGASTYEETHANTTDSTIKTYLEDTWYPTLSDDAKSKIVDAIYCNDRKVVTVDSSYTGDGSGKTKTYYAPYQRLVSNKAPVLTCSQENDRFTYDSTNFEIATNGKLDYPVGLMTADEAAMAGSVFSVANRSYYLYNSSNTSFSSLSPYFFQGSLGSNFLVSYAGSLAGAYGNPVSSTVGVRPVITLALDSITDGIGTMDNPFTTS